ncbi:MAG: helix-hairpin-helix domain-containing protein [Eubacteriales bacterium]
MEEKKKNVHAGHRARMRERFRNDGLDHFQPHEALELLLFELLPRVNTNPAAHALEERFGTVEGALTASEEELREVAGIGPKTAESLRSVWQVMSQMLCEHFRCAGPLSLYDIAFLADWFMDLAPPGSLGMLVCGQSGCFRAFVSLTPAPDDFLFSLSSQIVQYARFQAYFLLVKESHSCVSRETALMLRTVTGRGRARMLDVFVLEGYRPVSVLG